MRRPWATARHARVGLVGAIAAALLALPFDAQAQIKSQIVASGLSVPLAFIPDPVLPDTFYIVQQDGLVRTLQGGLLLSTPFADLTGRVGFGGEQGLLGMAFSPVDSNRVFFSYTDNASPRANVVSRFQRSSSMTPQIDPSTRLDLLWPTTGQRFIPQPFGNHNGGNIAFGPDGYLYIARGDGGSGNDPNNRAQTPTVLLGKILRIDVNVPDTNPDGMVIPADNPFLDGNPISAAPEIWAFGVRNPWRFTFDNFGIGATNALIIGDVGQNTREEINYEPAEPRRTQLRMANTRGADPQARRQPADDAGIYTAHRSDSRLSPSAGPVGHWRVRVSRSGTRVGIYRALLLLGLLHLADVVSRAHDQSDDRGSDRRRCAGTHQRVGRRAGRRCVLRPRPPGRAVSRDLLGPHPQDRPDVRRDHFQHPGPHDRGGLERSSLRASPSPTRTIRRAAGPSRGTPRTPRWCR